MFECIGTKARAVAAAHATKPRSSKSSTNTPEIFKSSSSLRLNSGKGTLSTVLNLPSTFNHPLSTNTSSVQFNSTGTRKDGSKSVRQAKDGHYGAISRENSLKAKERPSIEALSRSAMFLTGKSLSSSRILNFSGINKLQTNKLPEPENVSGILLSSRNK